MNPISGRSSRTLQPRFLPAALLLTAFTPLLCGFGPERAATVGTASLGRADANVATGTNIEALASNPAGVKRGKGQAFELGFMRNPLVGSNNFYLASADSSSPAGIAAGTSLGYAAGDLAGGGTFTTTEWRTGIAVGAQSDVAGLMIGASARRMALTLSPKGGKDIECAGWTGDVGMALDLAGGVMLGVTLRNVLDIEGIDTTRRIAGGLGYGGKKFVIEAAGSWQLNGDMPVYRAGLMIPLGDVAALRAGFVHDEFIGVLKARQTATLGGSVMLGRTRLDAGAEMNIADASEIRFGFALVYFMPYTM